MSDLSGWQGTLPQALQQAQQLLQTLNIQLDLPTARTVREWRTAGVLTQEGRKFTARNILELLHAAQLRDQGYGISVVRTRLNALSDQDLERELRSAVPALFSAPPAPPQLISEGELERTVSLLCMGIVQQYQHTQGHKLVGIYEHIPKELRQAQTQLSRMAILHRQEDRYASVHELLHSCIRPVHVWAPSPLKTHPAYRHLELINEEFMIPTEECRLLAEKSSPLANLIEHQFYQTLRTALGRLAEHHQVRIYTLIRGFIAEHPLATEGELAALKRDPRLLADPALMAFLDQSYPHAHAHEAVNKQVLRCLHCNAPIRKGECRLPTCRALNPDTQLGEAVPLDQARIVHSELMGYWCDPAQEELRVFRELSRVYGDRAELYPRLDACDISVGPIGIDVKDHRDPVKLAHKLNEGIGGLALYSQKYLAVATRRAVDSSYIPQLEDALSPALRSSLKVLSVDDTIRAVHKELQ